MQVQSLHCERSPREGNVNLFQYSSLENSMEEELGGYSPWGCKESDTAGRPSTYTVYKNPL